MNRFLAFIAALLAAALSVSSACTAAASTRLLGFTLQENPGRSEPLQLSFRDAGKDGHHNFNSSFRSDELAGLDLASFRAGGSHPLAFALIREAGRIDCRGSGGNSLANGSCSFAPNPAFSDLLAARGIARPSLEQSYELAITAANRDLVEALAQYHYPTPSIEKLVELAAVGANRSYMAAMVSSGYRPGSLENLVEMAAVGVNPVYIQAMSRAGYRNLAADDLVQMKAVGVEPEYIARLSAAGYPNLKADDLVQLRALDIDPAFIAGFARIGYAHLPIDTLVQLKALDVTPDYVQRLAAGGVHGLSPVQLGILKEATSDKRRH